MLTRSIRRIATDWKCHLGFYLHFNCPALSFKAGFGGRIIPTKRSVERQSASFAAPQTAVLPSPFHDKDAEDVKQKMIEEKTEERESLSMGEEDKPLLSDYTALKHDDKTGADVVLFEPSGGLQSSSPLPSMPSRQGDVVVEVDLLFLLQWKVRLISVMNQGRVHQSHHQQHPCNCLQRHDINMRLELMVQMTVRIMRPSARVWKRERNRKSPG